MQNKYKIIVSNPTIQKEYKLPDEGGQVKLGTAVGNDFRLYKDNFFESIEATFSCTNGEWIVYTAENLFIALPGGDVRKLNSMALSHGDVFEIRYQNSGNLALNVSFVIDFNDDVHKFNRYADISGLSVISMGADSRSNVVFAGQYTQNDSLVLERKQQGFMLEIRQAAYGVLHNGRPAVSGEMINNGDFFSIADNFFYIKNNQLWCEAEQGIGFHGMQIRDVVRRGTYPVFKRNSRIRSVLNKEKIGILDPAPVPDKPKESLVRKLIPSFIMVIAAAIMAFLGSAMMLIFSGVSVAGAIVTGIMTYKENKKDYAEKVEDRIVTYNNYVANKRSEIESIRQDELAALNEIYVSQEEEDRRFHAFSSDLFDRVKTDEDFLNVRFGLGDVEAERKIEYKHQEALKQGDELQQIPEAIEAEYKYIHGAPIVCDLKNVNAIGVVGNESYRYEIMKNMVVDLAARQYYTDVSFVFVAEEEHKEKIKWLRMLPFVYNENTGIRNLVMDDESKTFIFEYLFKELTARAESKSYGKRIIVFLYDEYGFHNHPLSRFVDCAKDLGVTFVFFADAQAGLPLGCDYIVSIEDSTLGYLVDTHDKSKIRGFYYNTLTQAQVERIVELLAPVYTDEISLEGSLRKSISMFEMLNILAVDDIDLERRWAATDVTKSMAAPLGVTKTGTIALDLHDKAHGPHGLVAGTTGSGKSEILQTYILSMATLFHPYEVGFVIIDFKGGGMVNQFEKLPHLIGTITNIDGKEIDRSLKSIKAELQKRQRLFAEAEVNHIDKYIRKFKLNEVQIPLPHLIIIVDEFAELKAEQPEFMKELISAARIGRSLGVHLILATQKPAGQVNEQIWSNSRFKLCLKVQSAQDSNEVLKSPLAAEIKEPGRAYLQVGNNEMFELLQSAYSGAPEKADNSNVREFSIFELTDSAKRNVVYAQKKKKSEGNLTQLDAIVNYVSEFCREKNVAKLPNICLPPLEERINFPAARDLSYRANVIMADIGIYDDPDNQYQGRYSVDLTGSNMMIIGSSQSGKTNLLQNIIRSVTTKYSSEEVNIYIMDIASMLLKNFEGLNHVGGVVTASEDEKLKNLMKLLFSEVEARKEKLLSVGVSSFAAYKEAGRTDLAQILLIIDNLTALKELYFQDDAELLNLCREGLSVGISIIIANSQTSGIGYKYLSNFSTKIAMFCNDSNEYGTLFDHCRERIENIPGRCLVEMDKAHFEAQTFLTFEGDKEIERVNSIKNYIEKTNTENNHTAKKIPVIPDVLTEAVLRSDFDAQSGTDSLVVGLNFANVSPVLLDYVKQGTVSLTGSNEKNKAKFVKYMIQSFVCAGSKMFVLDNFNETFADVADSPCTELYSRNISDVKEMMQSFTDIVVERFAQRELKGNSAVKEMVPLVFVINNSEAISEVSADASLVSAYKNILKKYAGLKALFIFTDVPNEAISYSSAELLKLMKDNNQWLIFENISNIKVFDCPIALTKKFKAPLNDSELFYLHGNDLMKIKAVSI